MLENTHARTWTIESLEAAVAASKSINETLKRLGLNPDSGKSHNRVKDYNINTLPFVPSHGRIWSDAEFIQAYNTSSSYSELRRKIGLASVGKNADTIRKHCARLGLDIAKLTKPTRSGHKIPLNELLINGSVCNSSNLKRRLIKERGYVDRCSICKITEWNGKPITLQLDHIDGVHNNNEISNLRIVCPNCHSQTETYCKGSKLCQSTQAVNGA